MAVQSTVQAVQIRLISTTGLEAAAIDPSPAKAAVPSSQGTYGQHV